MEMNELHELSGLLSGDLSPEETTRLSARLAVNPELREALERMTAIDEAARSLPPTLTPEKAQAMVRAVMQRQREAVRAKGLAPWLGGAVLGAALAVCVIWLVSQRPAPTSVVPPAPIVAFQPWRQVKGLTREQLVSEVEGLHAALDACMSTASRAPPR